jgi:hypothetical protein
VRGKQDLWQRHVLLGYPDLSLRFIDDAIRVTGGEPGYSLGKLADNADSNRWLEWRRGPRN